MTPAINALRKAKVPHKIHEYDHEINSESYGMEAAEKLGVEVDRVFKTLVVSTDRRELAVAVVPVSKQLDLKAFASTIKAKKSAMADAKDAERSTGYVVGGISPLGQRKQLKTVVDESATNYQTIFVSAGRRGLEIEISPQELGSLTRGSFASIAR